MNVLGISGTPRKGGNSEILLNAALEPFVDAGWDVTRILLSEKQIGFCVGCATCVGGRDCSIKDDMDEVYDTFKICNAIIISAPAYYRNVPAQLKAVMDRTFAAKGSLKGKFGGAISVGRGSSGGGQCIIHNYYLSSGMLCVPGELNGVAATADKPGDILASPRLEQARVLGRNVLEACCGKF